MKKLPLLLFCLSAYFFSGAKTIHAIYFANTDDGEIGQGCTIDNYNFKRLVKRLGYITEYKVEHLTFTDDKFTVDNFNAFISKIRSTDEDILIFYITTHGARHQGDPTDFPRLFFSGTYVLMYEKYLELKKLPHRNLLTVIDACNVYKEMTDKEIKIFSKTYSHDYSEGVSATEKANVKLLFEKPFNLIITSSQKGVASIATSNGSVFTNCFISSINYYLKSNNPKYVSLENILRRTKDYTLNESNRLYINRNIDITPEHQPHYPVWVYEAGSGESTIDTNFKVVNVFADEEVNLKEKDPSSESISIEYTATYLPVAKNGNNYKVVMKLSGNRSVLDRITQVKYILHHTFPEPITIATDKKNDYRYTLYLYGEFLLRAEVLLDDGTTLDLSKYLKLGNVSKSIVK